MGSSVLIFSIKCSSVCPLTANGIASILAKVLKKTEYPSNIGTEACGPTLPSPYTELPSDIIPIVFPLHVSLKDSTPSFSISLQHWATPGV